MGRVGLAAAAMLSIVASTCAEAETYDGALKAAQAGPRPAVARARYLASVAQTAIARSHGRPRITLDAQVSRNLDTDVYGPRLTDQTSLQLVLPLYAGGRIRADIAASRADERAAREAVADDGMQLAVAVADVYAAVREARALRAVAEDEVRRLTGYAGRIDAERRAGTLSLTDLAECRARLAVARRDVLDADRREADAAERFAELVGHLPGADMAPIEVAPLDGAGLDDAVRQGNPALRGLRAAVDAANERLRAQRGLNRPTLTFVGSGSYGNTGLGFASDTFVSLPDGSLAQIESPRRFAHRLSARGLLVLTVPLARGGEVAGRVAEARAELLEANERVRAREASAIADAREAIARARAALVQEALADASTSAAQEALKGVDIARSIGESSEHDVLVASSELGNAARQRARLEREAAVQAVRSLAAAGRLPVPTPAATSRAHDAAEPELASLRFDLASLPNSHALLRTASGGRPLAYDLTGLG